MKRDDFNGSLTIRYWNGRTSHVKRDDFNESLTIRYWNSRTSHLKRADFNDNLSILWLFIFLTCPNHLKTL